MKSIYELKLHEGMEIYVNNSFISYWVVRVPGGFMYHYTRLDHGQMNTVFVPYDNEFYSNKVRMVKRPADRV